MSNNEGLRSLQTYTVRLCLPGLLVVSLASALAACQPGPANQPGPAMPGVTNVTQTPPIPEAPDGTRGVFSKERASIELGAAANASARCKTPGGPTGMGKVKLDFDPGTGQIFKAEIIGSAFEGTAVGECVARTFLAMKIPPFDGSPVTTTKTFSVR